MLELIMAKEVHLWRVAQSNHGRILLAPVFVFQNHFPKFIQTPNPFPNTTPPSPEPHFRGLLTFSWMDPIFRLGWKRPLQETDVWQLPSRMISESLADQLQLAWDNELRAHGSDGAQQATVSSAKAEAEAGATESEKPSVAPNAPKAPSKNSSGPSLARAMRTMLVRKLAPIGLLKLASDCASMTSPFIVKLLVGYVVQCKDAVAAGTDLPPLSQGFGLAVLLFFLQIFTATCEGHYFFRAMSSGAALRTGISGFVYRKAMRLSAAARQEFGSGKVTNIVSTDAQRFERLLTSIHQIWTAPLRFVVITALLMTQLGPVALLGIVMLVMLTPLQNFVWKQLSIIRDEVAPLTDSRVKLTQEVFQGIRVIKFFNWETPFLRKIEEIRSREVRLNLKKAIYTAGVSTIAFVFPTIAAALTFTIYGLSNPLEPGRIFACVAWFAQLPFPLLAIPEIMVGLAETSVGVKRIQALMMAPEIQPPYEINKDAKLAIEVTGGEFTWEVLADDSEQDKKSDEANSKNQVAIVESGPKDPQSTADTLLAPEQTPTKSTLRNINLAIPRGQLVAI
eukprot:jgi/Hompol1/2649/HPOL_006098-RA